MSDIDTEKSYESTYTIRAIGGGFSVSVPKKVVERKAKEKNLSVKKFREKYAVKIFYDDFSEIDGAFKFVKKEADNREC